MRSYFIILLIVILLSGCAFKEQVGDYVTEAALESAKNKLEKAIEDRGVDVDDLKSEFLADKNGRISPQSVLDNAKGFAKDLVASEITKVQSALSEKILDRTSEMSKMSKDDLIKLKEEMDKDKNGLVSKEEMGIAVKDKIRDTADDIRNDTKNLITGLISDVKSGSISKEQFKSELAEYKSDVQGKIKDLISWIIGALGTLLAGYSGKQIFSVKSHASLKSKIEMLERLTGIDLNRNNVIGNGDSPQPPNGSQPSANA